LRRFVPHPRKMANVRRLVLAKASHTRPNRRGRLAPLRGVRLQGCGFHKRVGPPVPFKRQELAYGSKPPSAVWYWRAARVVPVTAIGPASKFRPDRCRRLLRPLKRGTHLASLARQLFRRARRSTGACPLRGLRSPYGLHSHGYAHRVSLVPPCAAFDEPTIIQDEPHAHSSPSATPCAPQYETGTRCSIRPVRGAYALISHRTDSTPPHLCAPDTGAQ
jgi:hypothetical protein